MLVKEHHLKIKEYLAQARELLKTSVITTYDQLAEQLELDDLESEINFLEDLLKTPDEFHKHFKQHCQRRMQNEEGVYFNWIQSPQGLANKLYWDIAALIFDPKLVARVLFPTVKSFLHIEIKEQHPILSIHVRPYPISQLQCEELAFCAISNQHVFDVRDLIKLPLKLQVQAESILRKIDPELADQLVIHNLSFRFLHLEIHLLQQKELSLKKAIEFVIKELLNSQSQMSQNSNLNSALEHFSEFYNALPQSIQNQLSKECPLLYQLSQGKYDDTTAEELYLLLIEHRFNPVLNHLNTLSPDTIHRINSKYAHNSPLESLRESYNAMLSPAQVSNALNKIKKEAFHDWLNFLLHCPAELYERILWYFEWSSIDELSIAADGIEFILFNEKQINGLLKGLMSASTVFKTDLDRITYAIDLDCPELLDLAIAWYSSNQALCSDIIENNLLHKSSNNPELVVMLLRELPSDQRLGALQQLNNGSSVLSSLPRDGYHHTLQAIIDSLETQDVEPALKITDARGNMPLHNAVDAPHSFIPLVTLYLKHTSLLQVESPDHILNTLLVASVHQTQVLGITLDLFPDSIKKQAAILINTWSIWPKIRDKPESLKLILELFDISIRLKVILSSANEFYNLIHAVAPFPGSLETVLSLLPENERSQAMRSRDHKGNNVLFYAKPAIQSVRWCLCLFDDEARFDFVLQPNKLGVCVMERGIQSEYDFEFIKVLLNSFSEGYQLRLIQNRHFSNVLNALTESNSVYFQRMFSQSEQGGLQLYCSVMRIIRPFNNTIPHRFLNSSSSETKSYAVSNRIKALTTELGQCHQKDKMRQVLLNFLNINEEPIKAVQGQIMDLLCPQSGEYSEKLKDLSKAWGIKPESCLYYYA